MRRTPVCFNNKLTDPHCGSTELDQIVEVRARVLYCMFNISLIIIQRQEYRPMQPDCSYDLSSTSGT